MVSFLSGGPKILVAPVLNLKAVSFRRAKLPILSSVSLDLSEGEIFCILGPSGSGKTTLLRIIAGLLTPSSGIVEIRGRSQAGIPPHKRDLGFVFQDPSALLPHLSVFENIAFPLRVGRRTAASDGDVRKAVNNVLDSVHLLDKAQRLPEDLSGGERQRVALARAFVYQPALLLLDEPLNSLDNITKEELLAYVAGLRNHFETTCLYITHDEREALRLADRIGMLVAGKLLQVGTPKEVFESPLTTTIARITSEWNLIGAEYSPADKGITLPLHSIPGTFPADLDIGRGGTVTLGFPVAETSPISEGGPIQDKLIFTGSAESAFRVEGREYVLVRVGQFLVRTTWDKLALPEIGSEVRIGIANKKVKIFAQ